MTAAVIRPAIEFDESSPIKEHERLVRRQLELISAVEVHVVDVPADTENGHDPGLLAIVYLV